MGNKRKNGDQHKINIPTTIANVFAAKINDKKTKKTRFDYEVCFLPAFLSRLNFDNLFVPVDVICVETRFPFVVKPEFDKCPFDNDDVDVDKCCGICILNVTDSCPTICFNRTFFFPPVKNACCRLASR